jgi:hypothetical protein
MSNLDGGCGRAERRRCRERRRENCSRRGSAGCCGAKCTIGGEDGEQHAEVGPMLLLGFAEDTVIIKKKRKHNLSPLRYCL